MDELMEFRKSNLFNISDDDGKKRESNWNDLIPISKNAKNSLLKKPMCRIMISEVSTKKGGMTPRVSGLFNLPASELIKNFGEYYYTYYSKRNSSLVLSIKARKEKGTKKISSHKDSKLLSIRLEKEVAEYLPIEKTGCFSVSLNNLNPSDPEDLGKCIVIDLNVVYKTMKDPF
tara:strand:+ start:312 stop:833 length:522 start_codon:yes stop_codon:yes gene_type:complete